MKDKLEEILKPGNKTQNKGRMAHACCVRLHGVQPAAIAVGSCFDSMAAVFCSFKGSNPEGDSDNCRRGVEFEFSVRVEKVIQK